MGTDIVSIRRIEEAYAKFGKKFLERILTEQEINYVLSRSKRIGEAIAGRFAAKEACAKVLGTGWRNLDWKEVEVLREASGAPKIILHNRALNLASQRDLNRFEISISHERDFAVAFVVAYGGVNEMPG